MIAGEVLINAHEEPWETKDGLKWVSTSKIPFIDENGAMAVKDAGRNKVALAGV